MDHLDDLKQRLDIDKPAIGGIYTLPESLHSPHLAKYLGEDPFCLNESRITESMITVWIDNAEVTFPCLDVSGTGANGPFVGLSVLLKLFVPQSDEIEFLLHAFTPQDEWTLDQSFPALTSTALSALAFHPQTQVTLASYPRSEAEAGRIHVRGLAHLKSIVGLDDAPLAIEGWMDLEHALPRIHLRADAPTFNLGFALPVALRLEALSVPVVDEATDDAEVQVSIVLGCDLTLLGRLIPLVATITDPNSPIDLRVDLENFTQLLSVGLDDLSGLVEGVSFADYLPELPDFDFRTVPLTLKNIFAQLDLASASKLSLIGVHIANSTPWNLVTIPSSGKTITLEEFDVIASLPLATKIPDVTISGTIPFGANGVLGVSLEAPDFKVTGGLAPDTTVTLAELFGTFTSEPVAGLPALAITNFAFSAQSGQSYGLDFGVGGDWLIPINKTQNLAVQQMAFSLTMTRGTPSPLEGTIQASLMIGMIRAPIKASYGGGGWTFEAGLRDMSLTDILKSFLGSGVTLPSEVPNVTLKTLDVTIAPLTKAFMVKGRAQVNRDLPIDAPGLKMGLIEFDLNRQPASADQPAAVSCTISVSGSKKANIAEGLTFESFKLTFSFDQAAKSWTLSGGIAATLFDNPVTFEAQLEMSATQRKITLGSTIDAATPLLELGSLGALTVSALSLSVTKNLQSTTPYTWSVAADGRIELGDVVNVAGELRLFSETTRKGFLFHPSESADARAQFTLDIPHNPVTVTMELGDLSITRSNALGAPPGWTLKTVGSASFDGFAETGIMAEIEKAFVETITAQLDIASGQVSLRILRLIAFQEIDLGSEIDLGKAGIDLSNFKLQWADSMASASFDLGFALPARLNHLLGTKEENGQTVPVTEFFNTYNPAAADPYSTFTRFTVTVNPMNTAQPVSLQIYTSPIKALTINPDTRMVTLDLDDCGRLLFTLPTIGFSTSGFATQFMFEQEDLKLPLTSIKALLKLCKLDALSAVIPDTVPFEIPQLFDEDSRLDVPNDVELPPAVTEILNKISNLTDQLPTRLFTYLNQGQLPGKFEADLSISLTGNTSIDLKVMNGKKLRLLGFAGLGLVGLELERFSLRSFMGGQVMLSRIDATLDQFSFLSMGASIGLNKLDADLPLPASEDLYTTLDLDKLLMLVIYQTGIPIMLPLFYDNLSFKHRGFTGLELEANLSFAPEFDFANLPALFNAFEDFFTDPNATLDPKLVSDTFDLPFTIGPTYVRLPEFLGGKVLGTEKALETIKPIKTIARVLNTMKTLSLTDFISVMPDTARFSSTEIAFSFLKGEAAWAITNPTDLEALLKRTSVPNHTFLTKYRSLSSGDREAVLALARVGGQAVDARQSALVFLWGNFNLDNILELEARFGLAVASEKGFGSGFAFSGTVARFFGLRASGQLIVGRGSFDTPPSAFKMQGSAGLLIDGREIVQGTLIVTDTSFAMNGMLALFPASSPLQISGRTNLLIDSSHVVFTGSVGVYLNSAPLLMAAIDFNNGNLHLKAHCFGTDVDFQYQTPASLSATLAVKHTIHLSPPPMRIGDITLNLGLSLNAGFDGTMTLSLDPNRFTGRVEGRITWGQNSLTYNESFEVKTAADLDIVALKDRLADYAEARADQFVDQLQRTFLNFLALISRAFPVSEVKLTDGGFQVRMFGLAWSLTKHQTGSSTLYKGSSPGPIVLLEDSAGTDIVILTNVNGSGSPLIVFGNVSGQPYLNIDGQLSIPGLGIKATTLVSLDNDTLVFETRSASSSLFTLDSLTEFRYRPNDLSGRIGLSFDTTAQIGALKISTPVSVNADLGLTISASQALLKLSVVCKVEGKVVLSERFNLTMQASDLRFDRLKEEITKRIPNILEDEALKTMAKIEAGFNSALTNTKNEINKAIEWAKKAASTMEGWVDTFTGFFGKKEEKPPQAPPINPDVLLRTTAQQIRSAGYNDLHIALVILRQMGPASWHAAVPMLRTIGCSHEVAHEALQAHYPAYTKRVANETSLRAEPVRVYEEQPNRRLKYSFALLYAPCKPFKDGKKLFNAYQAYVYGTVPVYRYERQGSRTEMLSTNLFEATEWKLIDIFGYVFTTLGGPRVPVYQYRSAGPDKSERVLYSADANEDGGWTMQSIAFYGSALEVAAATTDVRPGILWVQCYTPPQPNSGLDAFYSPFSGWSPRSFSSQGKAFNAINTQVAGSVPVYLYAVSKANGFRYMYSTNPNVGEGWARIGIMFYAYPTPMRDTQPVYQYHVFDANGVVYFAYDINPIPPAGWRMDKIAFYAPTDAWTVPDGTNKPGLIPIYEFHRVRDDTGWDFAYSTAQTMGAGWVRDNVCFYGLSEYDREGTVIQQYYRPDVNGTVRLRYDSALHTASEWMSSGPVFKMYTTSNNGMPVQAIYRYTAQGHDGDRYMYSANPNVGQGWTRQLIAFYAPLESWTPPQPVPVYEYHVERNDGGWATWGFFYDTNPRAAAPWIRDRIGFYGLSRAYAGAVPVYFYSAPNPGNPMRSLYSTNEAFGQGWTQERIAFYAFTTPEPNTVPVYQYSVSAGIYVRYMYATNPWLGQGWTLEKIAFYVPTERWVPKPASTAPVPLYRYISQRSDGGAAFFYALQPQIAEGRSSDGFAFNVSLSPQPGQTPIYQFHRIGLDNMLLFRFSSSQTAPGWIYDGIAFYASRATPASYSQTVYEYFVERTDGRRYMYSSNPSEGQGWVRDPYMRFYV